ncbi:hypothetical protein PV08_04349 [Exophiala spinifera]|uniref:Uncharacterized protein n=1 Tax=Exophiala spinifera TaxID=91928 RepID=A0A0D2BDX2_9EURO|nr:uncharacterized protein PV08_04349 [Exophiala spinifera]KIW17158.1 hypothetical protein PV08_04349 [Exophiala spinifera]
MVDRRSDFYDGVPEEASIALRVPPEAMNQLSLSSNAVKAKRSQKGLKSPEKAARKAGEAEKKEGTAQNQGDSQERSIFHHNPVKVVAVFVPVGEHRPDVIVEYSQK